MNELIAAIVAGLRMLTPGYLESLTPAELEQLATTIRWAAEEVAEEQQRRKEPQP